MQLDIKTNSSQVQAAMERAAGQVPFAMSRAINWTAQSVREAERTAMRSVFDRPTPYTLNSLFLLPATKKALNAEVYLKGNGTLDNSPDPHYLAPHIEGGDRRIKRFEQRLVWAGHMRQGERAVPGAGAKLDQYGNISRGQIVRILSQLKTAAISGDYSNATNSARSKRSRAREGYFVSQGKGVTTGGGGPWKNGKKAQHLARGVYTRIRFGASITVVLPVLLFVSKTSYQAKRLDFFGIGKAVVDKQFTGHWEKSWADALRTALLKKQGALF